MAIPCLLVGDHPALPSGLGRILRELAQQLADDATLDLDVRIVGCRPGGTGPDGIEDRPDIHVWSFLQSSEAMAQEIAEQVHRAWGYWWQQRQGVVLSIWDASRISVLAHNPGPWQHWAYLPVDAAMIGGGYTGAAGGVVQRLDRVLAYGAYGQQVLSTVRKDVVSLPHGLDGSWWTRRIAERTTQPERHPLLIGCVMTNQPRKDWPTACATIRELRHRGHKVRGWFHTDRHQGYWDIEDLLQLYGVGKYVQISTSALAMTDELMQRAYQMCGVTMLPSLGEGFGYPIVESLASGVPCVHTTFGGGAELVPRPEWKVPQRGEKVEPTGLVRPVLDAGDVTNAIERAWDWQARWADTGVGYLQGSVAHLSWHHLYPRWRSWVKQGLERLD